MTTWEIIGWVAGSLALICGFIAVMVCMASSKFNQSEEIRKHLRR